MMINNNSNWKQTLYCKRKNRAVNPFAISEKKMIYTDKQIYNSNLCLYYSKSFNQGRKRIQYIKMSLFWLQFWLQFHVRVI